MYFHIIIHTDDANGIHHHLSRASLMVPSYKIKVGQVKKTIVKMPKVGKKARSTIHAAQR